MKKQLLKLLTGIFLLALILSSCNKTVVNKEIYVDSYIHSIYDKNGVPVYNVFHTAYSFSKLSGVKVTGSSGTQIQLKDYSNGYSFYTPVDTSKYKTVPPAPESFTYDITYSNGDTARRVDATVARSLMPAQQLAAVKTATDIVVSWKPVANVEAYKVRIFSQDPVTNNNILIYESDFLVPKDATSDLSIPYSLVSLSNYLSTNLSFEVSSFIFEQNKDTFHAVSVTTVKKYFGI